MKFFGFTRRLEPLRRFSTRCRPTFCVTYSALPGKFVDVVGNELRASVDHHQVDAARMSAARMMSPIPSPSLRRIHTRRNVVRLAVASTLKWKLRKVGREVVHVHYSGSEMQHTPSVFTFNIADFRNGSRL
jgi:hypothetical protein